MKREHRGKARDRVSRIRTWFIWHQCCECKKDFRREFGWLLFLEVESINLNEEIWRVAYVCGKCAPTRLDALRIRKKVFDKVGRNE